MGATDNNSEHYFQYQRSFLPFNNNIQTGPSVHTCFSQYLRHKKSSPQELKINVSTISISEVAPVDQHKRLLQT